MSAKRQLLIDTALSLFYRQGINSTGINEVLSESGVAKKTLYNYFQSKEALVLAALEQRDNVFLQWLDSKLAHVSSDKALAETLFRALESWFKGNESQLGDFSGCFFINASAEFSNQDGRIRQLCSQHKKNVRDLIAKRMNKQSNALIDAICLLKEGAIVNAQVSGDYENIAAKCSESAKILIAAHS